MNHQATSIHTVMLEFSPGNFCLDVLIGPGCFAHMESNWCKIDTGEYSFTEPRK